MKDGAWTMDNGRCPAARGSGTKKRLPKYCTGRIVNERLLLHKGSFFFLYPPFSLSFHGDYILLPSVDNH